MCNSIPPTPTPTGRRSSFGADLILGFGRHTSNRRHSELSRNTMVKLTTSYLLIFLSIHVCLSVCGYMCMSAGVIGDQKRAL